MKAQVSHRIAIAILCLLLTAPLAAGEAEEAEQLLAESGVTGGLIVHVGCGEGKLITALGGEGRLVHGLDASAGNVAKARAAIDARGLWDKVSAERWAGGRLPHADNLVNLLIVEPRAKVAAAEVLRVLAPGAVAMVRRGAKWLKTAKPRPANIDDWTHYLHDPTNNAISADTVVGPPRRLRWVGGPRSARSHEHFGTVSAAVAAAGRLFYIIDEAPAATVALPAEWRLVARDAFNGVVLWKRTLGLWESHLRSFRGGPHGLARRLVAVGNRVYVTLGYGRPVVALDAATGKIVRTYKGTEGAYEILFEKGVLFLAATDPKGTPPGSWRKGDKSDDRYILVLDAASGKQLWKKSDAETKDMLATALAVSGQRVFLENPRQIVCLDRRTGQVKWRADRPLADAIRAGVPPTLVIYKDVVLSGDAGAIIDAPRREVTDMGKKVRGKMRGQVMALAVKDGRKLWSDGPASQFCAPIDVLAADGLIWFGRLSSVIDTGMMFARDPVTGEVKRRRQRDQKHFEIGMAHHRCHRIRGTERYLILNRGGTEFQDVKTGKLDVNHWIRGTCQFGVVPANGLLYVPPHSCACYNEALLNGLLALAPGPKADPTADAPSPQLEKGPGYAGKSTVAARPDDWPTYRHDAARSGIASAVVPAKLKSKWRKNLGGKLTSVTVAAGKVFLAAVDRRIVYALDAENGEVVWQYDSGGRMDSPPTYWSGRVLFGSADGWVYCLRAETGALAWRFRAAPRVRRIVFEGQLESAWPVHGSVLVQDGAVFFVAGRSGFLDGGLFFYSLNAKTGEPLSVTRHSGRDPKTGQQPPRAALGFDIPGILPDIPASDGKHIFLRHSVLDRDGKKLSKSVFHMFSSRGFLDASWWHRTYWQIGQGMGSGYRQWGRASVQHVSGRLLVPDARTVYGFGRTHADPANSHVGIDRAVYRLFAASAEQQDRANWRKIDKWKSVVRYRWSRKTPVLVRAMLLAKDTLFIAGPANLLSKKNAAATAALAGKSGGQLRAVAAGDGKVLAEYKLDAPPVFDGMAGANGRLYLATINGHVVCFAPAGPEGKSK